jgi:pyrimidine-nucleoside phosphorylase
VELGVGRNRTEDPVSPTAGLQFIKKGGDAVKKGDPIITVWAKDAASLAAAIPQIEDAVEYGPSAPPRRKLVLKEIAS